MLNSLFSMASEANSHVVSSFLDYLRIEKGLAPLSISAYTTDIYQFCEFLEKHKRLLLTARRADVREFLQHLFSHQVDGRSVGRKLSALRHLYRYLLLDKKIDYDPTLDIESPRQWKVLPKALARDEMEATLAAPMNHQGNARNPEYAAALALRDRAMLEVFYAGALRVSEMTNAKLEDLKLEAGYMLVRGKGDKERVVPLGRVAQDALREYLTQARAVLVRGRESQSPHVSQKRRDVGHPLLSRSNLDSGSNLVSRSNLDRNSPFLFLARGGRKLT